MTTLTIEDVKNLVSDVTGFDCDFEIVSGRFVVDAKSIMGIFSLDLLNPIQVTAHTEDAEGLKAKLERFIVK